MQQGNIAAPRAVEIEPLEPRRLLTAVIGNGFDPDVLPHEFTYTFDTSVADSLDDEDFSVENLTAN